MRDIILYLLVFCSSFSKAQSQLPSTIIFIDKSASASDLYTEDDLKKEVLGILVGRLNEDEHNFTISFVYQSTSNASNAKTFEYRVPKQEHHENVSSFAKQKQRIAHRKRVKNYQKKFATSVLTYIHTHKIDKTETDLYGSLRIAQQILKKGSKNLELFYISDMIPCSTVRYFCKNGKTIKSFAQAKSFAKTDLKNQVAGLELDLALFRNIKRVTLLLPNTPLSTKDSSTYMPIYWESVFLSLGIDSIILD